MKSKKREPRIGDLVSWVEYDAMIFIPSPFTITGIVLDNPIRWSKNRWGTTILLNDGSVRTLHGVELRILNEAR